MAENGRATWTTLTDAQLLDQCEVDTYRASGPGGQKRNKTSSAVRLRHPPTGLIVIAEESRSQHDNKAKALKRLRRALFLHLRDPAPADAAAHPEFAPALAGGRRRARRAGRGAGPGEYGGRAARRVHGEPGRVPRRRPETLAGGQPRADR